MADHEAIGEPKHRVQGVRLSKKPLTERRRTDLIVPYIFPGFSLHDELPLFVRAGLTPLEALQTATSNPAKSLGRERDLGTIETGKLADMVLLDAKPLADIANTKKINAVVVNGRFLDRATLDRLLTDVEAAVNKR